MEQLFTRKGQVLCTKLNIFIYWTLETQCAFEVCFCVWKSFLFWMWGVYFLYIYIFPLYRKLVTLTTAEDWKWVSRLVSERWAQRSMAVLNKQALLLTVSRVLPLLLPSQCGPLFLPHSLPPWLHLLFLCLSLALPSPNISLLFSMFVVGLVSTPPGHLATSTSHLPYFYLFLPYTLSTLPPPLPLFYYWLLFPSFSLMH